MPSIKSILPLLALALSTYGHAGVFDLSATMNGQTENASFTTAEEGIDIFEKNKLTSIFNTYNGTQIVKSTLNFRGLPMNIAFPVDAGSLLTFDIPELGIKQSFQGATRDESQELFKQYLKNNADFLNKVAEHLVKVSPVDPIAGNPNSMMSRAVQSDAQMMWYGSNHVFGNQLQNSNNNNSTENSSNNKFGIGINYAHMLSEATGNAKEMSSDAFTLPLSYSHQFAEPNHELIINMPLAYIDTEGAKTYDGSLSIFYRRPIWDNWVLSFTASGRGTGSTDLAGGSLMASGAIASSYVWSGENWGLTLGNMIGYYSALRLKIDNTSINPNIANTVFRNGLLYSLDSAWQLAGDPLSWEIYLVDTRFTGTDLFSSYQDEVGVTFGTRRPAHSKESDFRGGFSFTKGENVESYKFNFGTWF